MAIRFLAVSVSEQLTRRASADVGGASSIATMKTHLHIFHTISALLALLLPGVAYSQSLQDRLFAKVVAGTECKQTVNNGLVCEYKIGDQLRFSIKDAGDTDTVVGFSHSNINNELYAVLYFGCIVVVPGQAHPRNYDKDHGVYVSPKNGRVYKTKNECQSAR